MKRSDGSPIWNLVSLLPLRRDLLAPINEFVLGESAYPKEALDLLLHLYGAKSLAWEELRPATDGSVLMAELESELMERQPSLTRRLDALEGLVQRVAAGSNRGGAGSNAKRAVITSAGIKVIAPIWNRHRELSEFLLADVSGADQKAHYRVNLAIREGLKRSRQPSHADSRGFHPAHAILSIFEVVRDLRAKWLALAPTGDLDADAVELLLTEFTKLKESKPQGLPMTGRFTACEGTLHLFANRDLPALSNAGLIEIQGTRKRQGKVAAFRLTAQGILRADELWRDLGKRADEWLVEVTAADRKTHLQVNAHIGAQLRPAWKSLIDG